MSILPLAFALLALAPQSAPPLALRPAPVERLLEEIGRAPTDNAAREARLVELFRAAGAEAEDVATVPLDRALLEPRLAAARAAIVARLDAAGAGESERAAALERQEARWRDVGRNVIAVLPGTTKRVIGFAAHYDTAPGSRGAIDNWSGCVLLAELYRALKGQPHEHTFWFLGFAGQEEGCLGAASWVSTVREKQAAKIDALVTVECAGLAAPRAWWSGSSAGILEIVADAARQAQVPLQVVDFPGDASDSCEIKRAFLPVACLFGLGFEHASLLHGPRDRVEAIVPEHLAQMHALTLALAAEFDRHRQPLRWDYVQDKLRLADPASGRAPLVPTPIDVPRATPAAAPPPPAPAPPPSPARDGSHP